MRKGYIYLITNKKNNKIYVGQTSRDIDTRFAEHCSEKRGHSRLHEAIQEEGWQNFKIELLEEIEISSLDKQEIYWINKLNSRNPEIGYNIALGGSNIGTPWNKIMVLENNLIFDSKEEMGRIISKITSWSEKFIKEMINKALINEELFLGYHLQKIDNNAIPSDMDVLEDWVKTLNIKFQGKHIYCFELKKEFETIASAAQFLLDNNLYQTSSKTPVQSLVTSIGYNINGKSEYIKGINQNYSFVIMPGTTKKAIDTSKLFQKIKIYCPELDMEFNSQSEAAEYFINNNIWTGIKLKTAKLRISDIVRGAFPHYKNYTFRAV